MASIKKNFCLIAIICFAALIFSGCKTQRYTTKFIATPMDSVNEDLSIDPQKLTTELDDEMRIQDKNRREKLLEEAKAEAKKGDKAGQ